MTFAARLALILLIFIALGSFYYFGANRFPDYENYLWIADSGGFAVSEGDYWFEWISRFFLSASHPLAVVRVDILAIANQVVCLFFFLWAMRKTSSNVIFGVLLLFSCFGFLFMTTTLRASAAYLSISAFFIRGGRLDALGVALLLFALGWHDSVAPIAFLCCISCVFARICQRSFNKRFCAVVLTVLVVFSFSIIVFSDLIRPLILFEIDMDIGIRSDYFKGDGSNSFSKTIFLILVLLSSLFFVLDKGMPYVTKIYVAFASIVVSAVFLINAVAAVRFSLFIISVVLPVRGVFFLELERFQSIRFLAVILSPIMFVMSALFVLSSTV